MITQPIYTRDDPYKPAGWVCGACTIHPQGKVLFTEGDLPCVQCGKVTRTRRGMVLHLLFRHKIKLQGELFHENGSTDPTPSR